jgi:hypothetical protein
MYMKCRAKYVQKSYPFLGLHAMPLCMYMDHVYVNTLHGLFSDHLLSTTIMLYSIITFLGLMLVQKFKL